MGSILGCQAMYVRDERQPVRKSHDRSARPEWILPAPSRPGLPLLHEDPLLHAILANRLGSPEAARDFLDQQPRRTPDPHLLPGLSEALERVETALRNREPIGIFGDYDTDGVTSSALLTRALRSASGGEQPVAVRLPRRLEGYGLSVTGVNDLAAAGVRLLIAVDCGSKDHAAVSWARQQGMDVVILDHHRLTEATPDDAIVASAQLLEDSPYRTLSAAGLAFLLATALARAGWDAGDGPGAEPHSLIDLAMIGLIGDVSALTGVNRHIVRDGLRRLRNEPRPGLRAMGEIGGIDLARIVSTDVAFQISPRLNAPGRLGDPEPAFALLATDDPGKAGQLAKGVEQANQQRKVLQDRILREIEESLLKNPGQLERRVLIFHGPGWASGIVGLAASKLADRFGRPVIVLSRDDDVAHGSARSIPGFDIAAALSDHSALLVRHGGHERAAGLALPVGNLGDLQEALDAAIARSDARPPGPPRLEIDADLPPERLRLETARLVQTLGPFGEGNPVPLFRISQAPLHEYLVMGRERQHLKMRLVTGGQPVDAILWNGAARSPELVGRRIVDVAGTLETNVWNGTTRVQVRVEDFRITDG